MMENGIGPWALVATFAIMGLSVHAVARVWSPRRLFFIDLGRELTEADRARSRRVIAANAAVTVLGIGLSFAVKNALGVVVLSMLLPFVPITHLFVELIQTARSVDTAPAPKRFVVPLDEPPAMGRYLSPALELMHVALIVGSSAAFLWVVDRLPDRMPMHWNAHGQVDRWGSPHELWFFLGIMVFDWAMVWLVAFGVSRERWVLPPNEAERYRELQIERRTLITRLVEVLILLLNLSFAVMWLSHAFGRVSQGIMLGLILMVVGTVAPLVVYLGPLTRVQDQLRDIAGSDVLGTREDGWILGGLFYYAKDDPALFVPKRVGIGQTFNFARPGAWLFLGAVTVVPILITVIAVLVAQ